MRQTNDRITQIVNAIREKIKEWPPNLPPPSVVITRDSPAQRVRSEL